MEALVFDRSAPDGSIIIPVKNCVRTHVAGIRHTLAVLATAGGV